MKKVAVLVGVVLFLFADINTENKKALTAYQKGEYKIALNIWKNLCNKFNNIKACNNEALLIYKKAQYLNENQAKSVEILKKLIKQNPKNPSILYNLANIYWYGYYDNRKHYALIKRKEALKLFKEAAKLGYKPAKEFLKNNKLLDYNATDVSKKK